MTKTTILIIPLSLVALGLFAITLKTSAQPDAAATPASVSSTAAPTPAQPPTGTENKQNEAQPPAAKSTPQAVTVASGPGAWFDKLMTGGSVVVAQIILSIVAGAYAVGCWMTIRKERIVPTGLSAEAMTLWKAGDLATLENLGESKPSTLARAISFLVKHRDNSVSDLSTTAGDLAAGEISAHLQRAYPIAVIANLEPLLGLLGTVFGMIDCFDVVAVAGELGDPSLLANGISKALVTTAVGLTLAIPLLYVYHHFKSKISNYSNQLEDGVTRMTAEWFMEKADSAK